MQTKSIFQRDKQHDRKETYDDVENSAPGNGRLPLGGIDGHSAAHGPERNINSGIEHAPENIGYRRIDDFTRGSQIRGEK